MGCQGVTAWSTHEARFLTPHLAQTEFSGGFKASEVPLAAVPSALAAAQHRRSLGVIDHGAFHGWNAPYRPERLVELSGLSRRTWPRTYPFAPGLQMAAIIRDGRADEGTEVDDG